MFINSNEIESFFLTNGKYCSVPTGLNDKIGIPPEVMCSTRMGIFSITPTGRSGKVAHLKVPVCSLYSSPESGRSDWNCSF